MPRRRLRRRGGGALHPAAVVALHPAAVVALHPAAVVALHPAAVVALMRCRRRRRHLCLVAVHLKYEAVVAEHVPLPRAPALPRIEHIYTYRRIGSNLQ